MRLGQTKATFDRGNLLLGVLFGLNVAIVLIGRKVKEMVSDRKIGL